MSTGDDAGCPDDIDAPRSEISIVSPKSPPEIPRTVWAYAVGDSALPLSRWRALAIWADPKLPEPFQPVHSGGDTVRVGPVEYDFTNPLLISRASGHGTP